MAFKTAHRYTYGNREQIHKAIPTSLPDAVLPPERISSENPVPWNSKGRYRLIMRQPLVRMRVLNAILTNRFLLLKREPSKMRSFLTGQPFYTFFFVKLHI